MSDAEGCRHTGEAAGITRWLVIHDDLLRGVAHAMSNRLATIDAVAGILEIGGAPEVRFVQGLRQDAEQLEALLQTLRRLPRGEETTPEPMLVTDAIEAARRLVEHHPNLRGRSLAVTMRNDIVPVIAEPIGLAHALVVALLAAARGGSDAMVVVLETVGDEVLAHTQGVPDGTVNAPTTLDVPVDACTDAQADRAAIDWLLSPGHGQADPGAPGTTIRLRTLEAARRRAG